MWLTGDPVRGSGCADSRALRHAPGQQGLYPTGMPLMPTLFPRAREFVASVCFLAGLSASFFPARAQFAASQCATQPEGASASVRAVAGTCGTATFQIDAQQRSLGAVRLAAGGALYIRAIRLTYQGSNGGAQHLTQVPLHRLFVEGETTDPIPTARAGLSLVAVVVDLNPPGYGVGPVPMALVGPDGSVQVPASAESADAARTAGSDWLLIGSVSAHLDTARDVIVIGREKGKFDGIAIGSRGNDLLVQTVTIAPVNGAPFSVDVRRVLAPGTSGWTIPIDPPDFVHQVTVTYGTQAASMRPPLLEIKGHYAENWLGRVGDNRHYAGGWVMLGTADVIASPHHAILRDRLRVAGAEGPFKKLRFVARRGAVSLGSAVIDAGDGRQETLPVNAVLMPDTPSPPIALTSGAMPIESVQLSPRLGPSSRVDATVEVWAQY